MLWRLHDSRKVNFPRQRPSKVNIALAHCPLLEIVRVHFSLAELTGTVSGHTAWGEVAALGSCNTSVLIPGVL